MRKIVSLLIALLVVTALPASAAGKISKELVGRVLLVSNAGAALAKPVSDRLNGPVTYHNWEYTRAHWEDLRRLNTHLIMLLDRSRDYSGEEQVYGTHWPIASNCIATFVKKREGTTNKWAILVTAPEQRWLADEVQALMELDRLPARPRYRFVTRYAVVATGSEELARAFVANDSAPEYEWAAASDPQPALTAAAQRTLVVLIDRTRLGEVPEAVRREVPFEVSGAATNEVVFKAWERPEGLLGILIVAPSADTLTRAMREFASRRAVGEAHRRLLDLRGVASIGFQGPSGGAAGELTQRIFEGLRQMAYQNGGIAVVGGPEAGSVPVMARVRVIECGGRRQYWVEVHSRKIKEVEGEKTKVRTIWTFEEWYRDEASVYARLEFVDARTGEVVLTTGAGDWDLEIGLVRSERVEREGTERPPVPFVTRGEFGSPEPGFVARLARQVGGPLPTRLVNNIIWR